MTRPAPKGITAQYRAWTDADDATLRARYGRDEAKDIARDLDRVTGAVFHRARALGIKARARWTKANDDHLRMYWGDLNLARIAKDLGRTEVAVYYRAGQLGLDRGAPPGFEYITHAAERTGFCRETLVIILRWAGRQHFRTAVSRATGAKRHFHIVESIEVDEAVEAWLATETLEAAARRFDVCGATVERRLHESGKTLPAKPTDKTHWRVPTALVDEVMAARAKLETIHAASVRLGIPRGTLRYRMVRAGVPRPPGKLWLVPLGVADGIARAA